MEYPIKATWYLRSVYSAATICPDCPSPPQFALEKTKKCCEICLFPMMIWLFDDEQRKVWEEIRPVDMKKKDIAKAIEEETIGRVPKIASLPLFLVKTYSKFWRMSKKWKKENYSRLEFSQA